VLIRGLKPNGIEVARISCRMAMERRGPAIQPAQEDRIAAYHPTADGMLVELVGLWFDDCVADESFVHAPHRSFYPEDSVALAWRSLEITPQYHNLDWIAQRAGGKFRVPETFVVGATTALTSRTFGRVVANLGWHDVRLPTPVLVGDTIEAESTILETRTSRSRPGEDIVSIATCARNQHGDAILNYRRTLLVYHRGAAAPYERGGY
jgi:itaconyl-CoA hydratase